MESFALVRLASPELWAGLTTVLEEMDELSPDELNGILFALGEMQLGVGEEMKNSLVVHFFEKMHLSDNFNSFLFFSALSVEEPAELVSKALELMDVQSIATSKRPCVFLLNLALRSLIAPSAISGPLSHILNLTNADLLLFLRSAQSIIHPDLISSIRESLCQFFTQHVSQDAIINEGLLVDFTLDAKKIAVLLSSPLLAIQGESSSRPTGTALLRHRATQAALGPAWTVCNINASDWQKADHLGRLEILRCLEPETQPFPENESKESSSHNIHYSDPDVELDYNHTDADISPFIRRDRLNPHRKGAPPAEALPWVPSVLSLKTRKRPSRRKRNSKPS
jgi:hypothetical protein